MSTRSNPQSGRSTTTNRQTAVQIWLRMIRIAKKIGRAAEAPLQKIDLTGPQFDLLVQLGQKEGVMQQDLAQQLRVTKGNISQLLAKLEEKRLIRREKHGRTAAVFLTAGGRTVVEERVGPHDQFIAERFQALSDAEQTELLRLLRKIDRSLP
ncbi:MAG: MarR family transcriptional regulator [Ardenticatenaceae bacterium]|nr:MarR family transcriptional regulator [Ardenticatenaceae bacterium]